MTTQGGQDRIYTALNPLVIDGTLTPRQAERVYHAVGRETSTTSPGSAVPTTAGWDRHRLHAAASVLAAGLLATAYIVGTVVDERKDTSWKSTVMLIGTSLVVAAAGAAWWFVLRNASWSRWVSGLLGAVGFTGLVFSLLVMWDDSDAAVYITGIVLLAGGAAGFWFLKGELYTLVAVFGGVLVLTQVFSDTLSGDGESDILTVGIAFMFYGLAVGALGWFLGSRRVLALTGLTIAELAMFVVIVVNAAALALARAFSDPSVGGTIDPAPASADSVRSDIRVALFLGLLVAVVAAAAHAYDGFNGFAVLAFSGAALLPVIAMFAWGTDHPMRWATGFAVIGALGLAAVLGLQLDRRTPPSAHGYAGRPLDPHQGVDPHSDTISR